MMQIQFPDRMVSYDTFMADLSNRIAERIVAIKQEPEVISQRMAYRQYGRANVQRWVRQNKVHPCKRVGMMEYTTAELRKAQSNQQDYTSLQLRKRTASSANVNMSVTSSSR